MVTGLTASTAYDVYVVAEDVRGPNLQATPVLVNVTTNRARRHPAGLDRHLSASEPDPRRGDRHREYR